METFKIRSRAIIVDEGELLLVKHPRRDFYALPGGHLELGENPRECIKREILEELGIEPEVGRLLYVYTFLNEEKVQSMEFFFEVLNSVKYRNFEEKERTHASEIEEVRWVRRGDNVVIRPPAFKRAWDEGQVFESETRFLKN